MCNSSLKVHHSDALLTHSGAPLIYFIWGCFAMIKKENTRITVTVPKEIHARLIEEAEYEDRSVSNLVLQIIKEHYNIKND